MNVNGNIEAQSLVLENQAGLKRYWKEQLEDHLYLYPKITLLKDLLTEHLAFISLNLTEKNPSFSLGQIQAFLMNYSQKLYGKFKTVVTPEVRGFTLAYNQSLSTTSIIKTTKAVSTNVTHEPTLEVLVKEIQKRFLWPTSDIETLQKMVEDARGLRST